MMNYVKYEEAIDVNNYLWGRIFIYCIEHKIDFITLYKKLMIKIYTWQKLAKPNFLPENPLILSSFEAELDFILGELNITLEELLTPSDMAQKVIEFCDNLFWKPYEANTEDLCFAQSASYVPENFNPFESIDIERGKCLNLSTFEWNYYVDVNITGPRLMNIKNISDKKECYLNMATSSFIGNAFTLYRCNGGKIAKYIDFELELDFEDYAILDFKDAIVKTTLRKCSEESHSIEMINGIVFLLDNKTKEITSHIVPIMYCKECNIYYMHKIDYDSLIMKGRPLFRVTENIKWINKSYTAFKQLSKESIFKLCGYNVNAIEDLDEKERHGILNFMIQRKIVSIQETINFITWLINTHKNSLKYSEAIKKWRDDIKFVKESNLSDKMVGIAGVTVSSSNTFSFN